MGYLARIQFKEDYPGKPQTLREVSKLFNDIHLAYTFGVLLENKNYVFGRDFWLRSEERIEPNERLYVASLEMRSPPSLKIMAAVVPGLRALLDALKYADPIERETKQLVLRKLQYEVAELEQRAAMRHDQTIEAILGEGLSLSDDRNAVGTKDRLKIRFQEHDFSVQQLELGFDGSTDIGNIRPRREDV